MGMDIYAGTFTRYYARNWKTTTQQFCEENGINYSMIRSPQNDVTDEQKASPPEIEETVAAWQNQLVTGLQNLGIQAAATWKDDMIKPYYTDKPDWDAFNALLLYASAKLLRKTFPKEFPKNMDLTNQKLIKKAMANRAADWSLFTGVCHWIPIQENFTFHYVLANGKEAEIGTTSGLKYELSMINQLGWNANTETIMNWSYTEGYPTDGTIQSGTVKQLDVHEIYDTESLAKFAFSVLWQAVIFSEKEQVPIIMDY